MSHLSLVWNAEGSLGSRSATLLCPCLPYLFSKKTEATGGKCVFAPASRKTACVSESVPAHSAEAGLDFCV